MKRLDILLIVGWLVGLITQIAITIITSYGDVFPPQFLLALALCFGAGYRARQINPAIQGRRGALHGAAMMGTIVLGYFVVAFVLMGPDTDTGGETWLSLLVEAPFWVGFPLSTASISGYLGYRLAGRVRR